MNNLRMFVVVVLLAIAIPQQTWAAGKQKPVKICFNSTTGALIGRTKCKASETALSKSNLAGKLDLPTSTATALYVIANEDAAIRRSSGVSAVTRQGTGFYKVTFSRDVTNCSLNVGQAYDSSNALTTALAQIVARNWSGDPASVEVGILDDTRNEIDTGFSLLVVCND
jgi:hypothetical protein